MFNFFNKNKLTLVLFVMILTYIVYFSWFTVMRYRTLHASYFDLGIMHQTVYNSFMAIKTGDWSRFLELTNPHGFEQVKRMAVHNDIILGIIALFYFIYHGPETLLVLQTIILALGAIPVYLIAKFVINKKNKDASFISLAIAFAYLMYTPMQRANIFDFHAVTIATTTLLFMFYFWLIKKHWLSMLFLIISLLTKEQVALTTIFFGIYILLKNNIFQLTSKLSVIPSKKGIQSIDDIANKDSVLDFPLKGIITRFRGNDIHKCLTKFSRCNVLRILKDQNIIFGILVILISLIWFIVSMKVIVTYFRGSVHFALQRYGDFGNTTEKVFVGIISHPVSLIKYIWHIDTVRYFWFLLGPLGFLSLLSPALLIIALPEFAINLLSKSWDMRNIIYQYTAVLQPWIFIAAIYGISKIKNNIEKIKDSNKREKIILLIPIFIITFNILFAYFKGPLPFSRETEINLWNYYSAEKKDVFYWIEQLNNDNIKISSTGNLSPFFASRRYFYNFSKYYYLADYIVIRPNEIFSYADKKIIIPIYRRLQSDVHFKIIYEGKNFEVYKKITN